MEARPSVEAAASSRQTVLVTNDDGIDAPGLLYLVQLLVAADRYRVLVCAPDVDNSGDKESLLVIRWIGMDNTMLALPTTAREPIVCWLKMKILILSGEPPRWRSPTRTPADCASLGISGELFSGLVPDLVVSGINIGNNCGYHVVYSGTVAGAREAFVNGVPSIAISYDWVRGKSNLQDLKPAAEVCLPVINAVLTELKNKTYPKGSYLNVDVPTDVTNHKGFKITKQGKYMIRIAWKPTKLSSPAIESYQTANIDGNIVVDKEMDAISAPSQDQLLFKRVLSPIHYEEKEDEDTDYRSLKNGHITITPLGALSLTEIEDVPYFKDWLKHLVDYSTYPSSL